MTLKIRWNEDIHFTEPTATATGSGRGAVIGFDVDIAPGIGAGTILGIGAVTADTVFVGDLSRFPINSTFTEHQSKWQNEWIRCLSKSDGMNIYVLQSHSVSKAVLSRVWMLIFSNDTRWWFGCDLQLEYGVRDDLYFQFAFDAVFRGRIDWMHLDRVGVLNEFQEFSSVLLSENQRTHSHGD